MAHIDVGLRPVGSEPNHLARGPQRLCVAPQHAVAVTGLVPGLGIVGIRVHGLFKKWEGPGPVVMREKPQTLCVEMLRSRALVPPGGGYQVGKRGKRAGLELSDALRRHSEVKTLPIS